MIPLLLLLAIGAVALAGRHGAREAQARALVPMPPSTHLPIPSTVRASGGAPSPLVVLDGLLQAGQTPPPFVIACAIAEAESIGRDDVSAVLFKAFVVPMVAQARAAQVVHARDANPMPMPMPMPGQVPPGRGGAPTPVHPSPAHPHAGHHHGHHARIPQGPQATQDAWHAWPSWGQAPQADGSATPAQPPPGLPSIADPAYGTRVEIVDRPDRPVRRPTSHAQAPAAHGPGPGTGRASDTITISGMNSPIAEIPNDAWTEFARRVAREQPTFTNARHVGQYRQRRERLAELGFDPDVVAASPDLQGAALAADMADAHRHMSESGLVAEYCGMTIDIPESSSGVPAPIEVTLSGIMGVVQAAGLEGAAGWLAQPTDRRRFPHTTAAFLRTNGAF